MRSVARGFKTQDDRCKSFILNPTKVHSSCTSRNKLKKFVRQERQSYKNQVKQYSTHPTSEGECLLLNLPDKPLTLENYMDDVELRRMEKKLASNKKFRTKLVDHGEHRMLCVLGFYGSWRVSVYRDLGSNRVDFTIGCVAAINNDGKPFYRYFPDVIEFDITAAYGGEVYKKWREQISSKESIDKLKLLVKEVRKNIKDDVCSITCSDRSTRLCEKVGIPVMDGIAILMKDWD